MVITRTAFIVQLVLIIALAWSTVYLGRDEIRGLVGEPALPVPAPPGAAGDDGGPEVRVSPAIQTASGIETRALAPHAMDPALPMQGRILDLGPLLEARALLVAANTELPALRAAVERSRLEHRRLVTLYQADQTASQRAVETAEAERVTAESRLAGAESRVGALVQRLRQDWGPEIARWAMAPRSPELERLLDGQEVLLMMTLAPGHSAPPTLGPLEVVLPGNSGPQRRATPVSPAPRTDPAFPGTTFFFRTSAEGLRSGERVAGRLVLGGSPTEGVTVPDSAVIWHGGSAWVYVQEAPDRFERRAVSTGEPAGDGWFDETLKAGERVVVRGAQLLLSEEFRGRITNENED